MEEHASTLTQNQVFKVMRVKVSRPSIFQYTHFKDSMFYYFCLDEKALSQTTNDADFSYKEVSDLSDATEDVQAESVADDELNELDDYNMLV